MMIIIILASFLFISLLVILVRIVKTLLWTPLHVQFMMRSQGVQGPSYKFLHGNFKEIVEMKKDAINKPMDHLSHDIFPRILPHIYSWKKLYGKFITHFIVKFYLLVVCIFTICRVI